MSVRLIAFDLDYTLLRTGGALSDFTAETLKFAAERGIELAPATGRGVCEMGDLLEKIPSRYVISVNGAVIFDRKENGNIYEVLPEKEDCLRELQLAESLGAYVEAYSGDKIYTSEYCHKNSIELGLAPDQHKLFYDTRTVVPSLYPFMKERESILKVDAVFKSEAERIEKSKQFSMDGLSSTSAFPNGLEFTAVNAHKGSGLRALSEILGISRDEVMSIGDGLNDVPMLSFAGVSVAMGNAVDEAKAAAKYITLDNDSDGAAHAIRKFALGEE